ncbi:MAG: hypothetical protein O7G85_01370 [Planctomycetota bacterium]|nr:hypothetical protein [Planctomycetota bacterium]
MKLQMKISLAMATGLAITGSAQAGFTTVVAPTAAGEIGHAAIFDGVYGGSFSASGLNFTNGSITATRIHDFDSGGGHSGSLNLLASSDVGANDQVWHDGIANLQAVARYAGYSQDFGYYQGSDNPGTGFTSGTLLSLVTNPFLGEGPTSSPTNIVGDWRWGRDGTTTNSSLHSDNVDGLDHMVTYMITGAGLAALGYDADATIWMIFFDDQEWPDTDRDFNDLAVEIVARAIPIPAPVMLAGLGLLGLGLSRRRLAASIS